MKCPLCGSDMSESRTVELSTLEATRVPPNLRPMFAPLVRVEDGGVVLKAPTPICPASTACGARADSVVSAARGATEARRSEMAALRAASR